MGTSFCRAKGDLLHNAVINPAFWGFSIASKAPTLQRRDASQLQRSSFRSPLPALSGRHRNPLCVLGGSSVTPSTANAKSTECQLLNRNTSTLIDIYAAPTSDERCSVPGCFAPTFIDKPLCPGEAFLSHRQSNAQTQRSQSTSLRKQRNSGNTEAGMRTTYLGKSELPLAAASSGRYYARHDSRCTPLSPQAHAAVMQTTPGGMHSKFSALAWKDLPASCRPGSG